MAIGRTREEQELNKLLVNTLVRKEVMEPMEKIGWGHGAPPAPDYTTTVKTEGAPAAKAEPAPAAKADGQPVKPAAGQPATPAAKADTPGFSFNIEDFKNPLTGKYFDKYDSAAEAMKGLGHLANMAKTSFSDRDRAIERAAALEAENAKLRSTPAASPAAAPTSASPTTSRTDVEKAQKVYDTVLSEIADDGGVINTENAKKLSAAQRELSRAEGRFAVAESQDQVRRASDAENARWTKVNEYMESKYPKASQFATEIGLHVQSDPLLAKAVAAMVAQGNEIDASEMAWLSYERAVTMNGNAEVRAQAEEKEVDLAAREQVRIEAKERALKDAGVVTGSPGGAGIHQNPNQASSREEIDALAQAMKRTGEAPGSPAAAAWRHAVIGRFLDPSIFGPGS